MATADSEEAILSLLRFGMNNNLLGMVRSLVAVFWLIVGVCFNVVHGSSPLQDGVGTVTYLQTDKSFYVTGETLWFRLFSMNEDLTMVSPNGERFVISLVDEEGSPVVQTVIENGSHSSGGGALVLPSHVITGRYRVYSYPVNCVSTPGVHRQFKEVFIYNPTDLPVGYSKKEDSLIASPESGIILGGVLNTVGVAFPYWTGHAHVESFLLENDVVIDTFTINEFGTGRFQFLPKLGASYEVRAVFENGKEVRQALPAIRSAGYVIHLDEEQNDGLGVKIAGVSVEETQRLSLSVQHQGVTSVFREFELGAGATSVLSLDDDELPNGVSELVLLNKAGDRLASRLIYYENRDELQIQASLDHLAPNTRQNLQLDILTSVGSQSTEANLSISIYRIDSLQEIPNHGTINSHLLLERYLKGDIAFAGQYFRVADKKTRTNLINTLLLTQQLNTQPVDVSSPVLDAHKQLMRIQYLSRQTRQPHRHERVYLSVPGSQFKYYNVQTDELGVGEFYIDVIHGDSVFITGLESGEDTYVEVLTGKSPSFPRFVAGGEIRAMPEKELLDRYIGAQVREIYQREGIGNDNTVFAVPYSPFYGKPDVIYNIADYTVFETVHETVREYVGELRMSGQRGAPTLRVLDNETQFFLSRDPLILFGGLPVFDTFSLGNYNPSQLSRIEIISSEYYFGGRIYGGVVNFIPLQSYADYFEFDQSSTLVNYQGVQDLQLFYWPNYDNPEAKESRVPDFRNLIFWEPNEAVKGKSQIAFSSSDLRGTYLVNIEGVSIDGRPGSTYFTFEVQ